MHGPGTVRATPKQISPTRLGGAACGPGRAAKGGAACGTAAAATTRGAVFTAAPASRGGDLRTSPWKKPVPWPSGLARKCHSKHPKVPLKAATGAGRQNRGPGPQPGGVAGARFGRGARPSGKRRGGTGHPPEPGPCTGRFRLASGERSPRRAPRHVLPWNRSSGGSARDVGSRRGPPYDQRRRRRAGAGPPPPPWWLAPQPGGGSLRIQRGPHVGKAVSL